MGSSYSSLVFLPPHPSYTKDDSRVKFINGENGNDIPIMTFKGTTSENPYYILFTHGNAEDIGQSADWYRIIATSTDTNVIAYDYSGYGHNSETQPSESNCYADAISVYKYIKEDLNVPDKRIIVYGRSLGSGNTCELGQKFQPGGVILQSPIASTLHVVSAALTYIPGFNMFANYKKINKINSPLLIIHGDKDEVVPYNNGQLLSTKAKNLYKFFTAENCGHNDIEYNIEDQLLTELQEFIAEIKNINNNNDDSGDENNNNNNSSSISS
eukprot:TRINITY_DN2128_c0_g1_i1.p1 TRINITY_DN2128_c0_g1~~TRINITY_DN2128_c0_g1_i1.p1  ORF type:complete len:270 (+),score=87.57 TRINITY_DN2128_c0_g1_i1:233-1042(+)